MYLELYIVIWICLFTSNRAMTNNCLVDIEPLNICAKSLPLILDTKLFLNDIVSIEENDNSIGIQASLACQWKPPQLNLSKVPDM